MREVMLTTIDNPYDPFTQFEQWFQFDELKGYCSCGLLARIAKTSNELADYWNKKEIERAIDEIIEYDPLKIYKKAVREINKDS